MANRFHNLDAPFQTISNAARITGLSRGFLRNGCKNGEVPHLMVGKEYRINIPALLERLQAQSIETLKGE